MNKAQRWVNDLATFNTEHPHPPSLFGTRFSETGSYPFQKALAWVDHQGHLVIGGERLYTANQWSGADEVQALVNWILETFDVQGIRVQSVKALPALTGDAPDSA